MGALLEVGMKPAFTGKPLQVRCADDDIEAISRAMQNKC